MTTEETVFGTAAQIGCVPERVAFLERACGGDAELRWQVESLLCAHDRAGDFLEPPARRDAPAGAIICQTVADERSVDGDAGRAIGRADASGVGTLVGPYKLLERLGEGGMGVVFMAEQLRPVRRRVALKIIKPGMDSRQVIARFEAERQALAMMDHPGIARVLDTGTTEAGRPYFAMELVRGVPITEYCDTHHLTPRERLELFVPVCQAVQHAHQKGVIHRDLKPSNVLVTPHDGAAVSKVIDFGIAKATAGHLLSDDTLFTRAADMVGTPLYMSPEQAQMGGMDVDTRSDVYSLGVLLYELLTGSTPFDKRRLGHVGLDEVRRIIREEDPPRPSTRIGTLGGETLGSVSAQRKTDPKRLGQLVRGELDWIVMRCLEKDRTRRYETANGLARDVERYLADEPVAASPPSTRYRVGKFVRRHRGPVLAASLLLLALVGGVVGTTWGLVRAERGRLDAEIARRDQTVQRGLAEENAGHARRLLVQLARVNGLLSSMFGDLDPNVATKQDRPLRAVLVKRMDEITKQLEGEAIGDAVTVAKLQNVLGCSQRNLGYANKSIPLLARARETLVAKLGPRDPFTLEVTNNLAVSYVHNGQPTKAVPLFEEALAAKVTARGPDHKDSLILMGNLGDAYATAGRLAEAVPLLERTLKLQRAARGPNNLHALAVLMNLARAYQAAGRMDDAVRLGEEAVQRHQAHFAGNHRQTLMSLRRLADTYRAAGRLDDAVPLYEQAVTTLRQTLGSESPDTCSAMVALASAHHDDQRPGKAVPLLEEALAGFEEEFGVEHRETLWTMGRLGLAYHAVGRLGDAITQLERALAVGKKVRGPTHPETLVGMNNLAFAYKAANRLEDALPLFERALAGEENVLGPAHHDTLISRANLADAYRDAGRPEAALALIERQIHVYEASGNTEEANRLRRQWALPSPAS